MRPDLPIILWQGECQGAREKGDVFRVVAVDLAFDDGDEPPCVALYVELLRRDRMGKEQWEEMDEDDLRVWPDDCVKADTSGYTTHPERVRQAVLEHLLVELVAEPRYMANLAANAVDA